MPRCRLHFAIPVGVGVLLTLGLLLGSTILKRVSPTEIDSEGTDACDPANSAPAALPERRPAPIDDSATRRSAAERLLAAAIREVDDMREPSMKSITYGRIAEVQLKLGDVAAASETAAKIEGSEKDETYGRIAQAQLTVGAFAAAKESAARIEGNGKNQIYERISAAEALAGNVAAAMETASRIKGRYHDWVYRRIVAAQAKAGDVRGAEETVETIADGYVRTSALRAIAAAQLKAGDLAGARATVERSNRGPWSTFYLVAMHDVQDLIEIASLQIKAGDKAGASKTLEAAAEAAAAVEQANVSVPVLLDVVAAQAKMEDRNGVGRTLAAARKAAARIPDKSKPSAYHRVFAAQVVADDLAGAKAEATTLTDQFDGHDLRPVAYGGIALAQARGGDLAGARATLAKTRDDDERRSFGKAWTCARIASLRAEAGDIEGAKVLAAEAGPWRGPADHDIVKAQVKHGDIAGAKKMAARMDDERCVIEAYVTIAEAEAQHGQLADARRTIDKAEAAAVRAKDDDGACRYIAPAREKMGDLAGAIATATKFGAWRDVASLQAKTGDVDAARKTWKKAITAAQRARERSSIDAALAGIVNDQIGVGELASAKETASSITGERTRRDACNAIVSRQALVGDVAAAIEYASSLADDPVTRCVRLVEAANAVCPPDQVREPR